MNYFAHSPLLQSILKNALLNPQKVAIVIDKKEVSYCELSSNVLRAASFLKDLNLKKGDRIIISAHKEIEYLYIYLGAQSIGVINVIVDAQINEERLNYIESKVRPSYCFGYDSKSSQYKLFEDIDLTNYVEYVSNEDNISQNDIAEILFTTGTTGAPKGVCLSYFNIYSSASNINEYIQNKEDDVELLALPICHSFGMGRIRCCLIKGSTIVILGNFSNVRAFIKSFETYHITGFGMVPAAWAYIHRMSGNRISKYANQVKYIEIGSAAMAIDTKKELLEMFPNTRICMHYGLTEASRSCFQEFHDVEHLNSIGKPVSNKVDVKIFDAQGKELQKGETGELCIRGNMVLSRYLEDIDTHKAFWGDYFRTGDLGYINEDGYIYLLGREKEIINVGGKKVSPMEVEDAIIALGVGDCICVPMDDKQGVLGEVVMCYILKDSTDLSFEEISEKLSQTLELYKRPVAYDWIDKIPMTSSGKKQRLKVK